MDISLGKKVGAEFMGTFFLMFAAIGTAIEKEKSHGPETVMGCATTSGLAVMIIICSIGHISGAHLNPLSPSPFKGDGDNGVEMSPGDVAYGAYDDHHSKSTSCCTSHHSFWSM
ncbi:Aquaporin NIP6-1 [Glycine soja]